MRLHVDLTQEHLDTAKRGDPCHCAVALAVRAACDRDGVPLVFAMVDATDVSIELLGDEGGVQWKYAAPPTNIGRLIMDWDALKPVAPASFDLEFEDRPRG